MPPGLPAAGRAVSTVRRETADAAGAAAAKAIMQLGAAR